MFDAPLSGVGRCLRSHGARHVSRERNTAFAGAFRDREIRLWRELAVHFDEIHAELHERIHAGDALGGRARENVWDGNVTPLEVRTRAYDAGPGERSRSN